AEDHASPPTNSRFQKDPYTDFTIAAEREKMRAAIQEQRRKAGQRHPLLINNKPVSTSNWQPSLNPANQTEVVGYAAQATVAEAEAALAAARAAQPNWGRTPAADRAALLEKVASLMRRDKPALCALEIL